MLRFASSSPLCPTQEETWPQQQQQQIIDEPDAEFVLISFEDAVAAGAPADPTAVAQGKKS